MYYVYIYIYIYIYLYEQEALHSLMNDDKIVNKPADKGSAIVLLYKKSIPYSHADR